MDVLMHAKMLPLVEAGGVGQSQLVVVEEAEVTDVVEVADLVLLDPPLGRYPFT